MSSNLTVLGCDPGFSSFGFAVVNLSTGLASPRVTEFGVLRTQKDTSKAKILTVEDNTRRVREIIGQLHDLFAGNVLAVCAEAMSHPRSASVAAKVALVWGALIAMADRYGVPILQASPQHVKRALCGRKDASKEDVQRKLHTFYPESVAFADGLPRTMREHPYDALACAHVMLDAPEVRMAMKAWRGAA